MELRKIELDADRTSADRAAIVTWCLVAAIVSSAIVFTLAGYFQQVLGVYVMSGALWAMADAFDRSCWRGFAQLVIGAAGVIIAAVLIGR